MKSKVYFSNHSEKVFIAFLLLSLFVHLGVSYKNISFAPTVKESPSKIRVTLTPADTQKAQQIVNSESSNNELRDKDAKFLSQRTQSFDEQKVAKKVDSFNEAGKGTSNIDQKSKQNTSTDAMKDNSQSQGERTQKKISLSDLAIKKTTQVGAKSSHEKSSPAAAKGQKNGDPSKSGLASNNDYIEEMPLGDFTQLNTIEYKYFGFYHRIRQQLEQYWGDSLRQRAELLFRAGRSIASNKSHVTSLSITIDSQGQIRRIKVNSPSGVKELDEAAVESFNKAGPFPNPPRELVKDGEATIQWGFVVKS